MSKLLDQFNKLQLKEMPDVKPGYTIKVHQKIKEGDKERIQIFEGIVIARKHGKGITSTVTVRKVTDGIGIERIFPVHSPAIEKIEVIKKGKARRSKLYYLRTAKGRKSRLKNKEFAEAIAPDKTVVEETLGEIDLETTATEITEDSTAKE
jgi:large subunit ribosomal protein L19